MTEGHWRVDAPYPHKEKIHHFRDGSSLERITGDKSLRANSTKMPSICGTALLLSPVDALLAVLRASATAPKQKALHTQCFFFGADYGARTRHLDLGKVALYQMS